MTNILVLGMTEFFILLFAVLAYMIKYKGRIEMIAGYDAKKVKDRKGLADFVGNNLILLAVCAAIAFIFELAYPPTELVAFLVFASMIVPIVGIVTFFGMRKFMVR